MRVIETGMEPSRVILLTSLLFSAARAYEGSPKNDREQAIEHVLKAISFYERADALPIHGKACEAAIKDALSRLENVEAQAKKQDWRTLKESVGRARNKNAICINTLKTDGTPLGRALSYLILQSERKLAIADDKLGNKSPASPALPAPKGGKGPADDKVESMPKIGCPRMAVDGTKCQFSECGKGLGLTSCAFGFAKGVVGGLHGKMYTVTDDGDSPGQPSPGTLRYGTNLARDTLGIWITFSRDMVISLQEMLWVQSRTTIDGRGFNITITNRNLVVGNVRNVIIHNIQVSDIRGTDSVHIFARSSLVWVDHVSSSSAELGLVSVLQGATDVTISNCKLQNHNFNMLLGASDADVEDKSMRVTVYRNWFLDSTQRMPHCRWGSFHVANNLYTNWGYYAIGARVYARVKSEKNAFVASRATEVTPWFEGFNSETFDSTARIESHGDLFVNKTTFHQFLVNAEPIARMYEDPTMPPPLVPATQVLGLVKPCAGALFGAKLAACIKP